ncbi:MFS transporter [Shinella sp. CPCC 100929]|uniref:MFS transporter n=1 Tax=Shinella lacus TaxID=2654216 RepID=A0ABT1RBZ2_9HYPH|nr:MFS transporter [Shinella lacus]
MARAGACDWILQRDLQHHSRWTETLRTPTWMDYLRMNHRLSPADQEIARALAALHQGETRPQTELAIERPARRGLASSL